MSALMRLAAQGMGMLRRGAQRHRLRQAAHRAHRAFVARHPLSAALLFDEHFLRRRALPVLMEPLPSRMAKAEALTMTWLAQWGLGEVAKRRFASELLLLALDFLALYEQQLHRLSDEGTAPAAVGGESFKTGGIVKKSTPKGAND